MKRHIEATAAVRADLESVVARLQDPTEVVGPRRGTASYVTDMLADLHDGTVVRQQVVVELELLEGSDDAVSWRLAWRPQGRQRVLPAFEGSLVAQVDGSSGTALLISGTYHPPLGPLGALADAVGLHRVARRTLVQFTQGLAAAIDVAVDQRHRTAWATPGLLPDDLRPMPSEHWLG